MSIDSIKVIHDTVFSKGENAYDLVSKIDSMYSNGWNRATALGGIIAIIVAIVLVLIPIVNGYLQRKQNKMDRENEKVFLDRRFAEMRADLEREFEVKMTNSLTSYNVSVQASLNAAKSSNSFLVAESKLNKKDYPFAFIHFASAIRHAIAANDLANVKSILVCMIVECIPKMTMVELNATQEAYSINIKNFVNEIVAADPDNILFEEINRFKSAIGALAITRQGK